MSERKDWKDIVLEIGLGTVSDRIGMSYEVCRGCVLGGKQPGREVILRLIKFIPGITVEHFLDEITTERRPYNKKKGAKK
jgi:hypothetical protein